MSKKNYGHTPWSDDEIGYLLDNPDLTARKIGEALGKGPQAAVFMRRKLASGWSPVKQFFSAEEDAQIAASPYFTAKQLAEAMGRTEGAVKWRRSVLRRDGRHTVTTSNKSAFKVGQRSLLAKTCRGCGRLLAGRWYHYNKKQREWQSKCSKCMQAMSTASEGYVNKNAKRTSVAFKKAMASITTPAERGGEPWLESDMAVLSDPDMTLLEKALKLKRTYAATATACLRHGFSSAFGLGDPERDRWMIENPNLASDGTLLVTVAHDPEPTVTEQRQPEPMWA